MDLFARPWMLLVALPAGFALYWAERTLRRGRAARIAMRSILVALLSLAAAGPRLGGEAVRPACVFALDISRSMGEAGPVEDAYFRARESLPAGTPRAVSAFAGEAKVLLGFAEIEDAEAGLGLGELAAALGESSTDIARGLRSGLGLIPPGAAGAVVLVSDGRETEGRALQAAFECRSRAVPVFVIVPEVVRRADLRVDSLTVPSALEAGRPVPLVASVSGSVSAKAEVTASRLPEAVEIGKVTVALRADSPTFVGFRDRPQRPGSVRYEVRVRPVHEALGDGWPGNDYARAVVQIRGLPRVLVVSRGGAAEELVRRAGADRFAADHLKPDALPWSADSLSGYAAVLLEGLGRGDVSAPQEAALVGYVSQGGGLLVTGGPGAFGAGGWRDTDALAEALPVKMTPGPLKRMLVVPLMDTSGSMKMEGAAGRTKMELAREAVAAVLPELGRDDEVALVAFRDRADLLLGPLSAAIRDEVLDSVRDLEADGPTSLVAPLEKGLEVLRASRAEKRVAILFSDGEPTVAFSREELFELARGFRGEDTSLHVLGTNPSPEHRKLLEEVAQAAGGIVEHQSDYSKVTEALRRLFALAASRHVREGPLNVLPGGGLSELLEGLGPFPALGAVNRTQLEPGAHAVLVAATGEPVLALGQAGVGLAAAFTSTLGEPWAGELGSWEKRVRFLSQLLREIMPPPADEGVTVRAVREGKGLFVEIEAVSSEGKPRNLLDLDAELVPALSAAGAGGARLRIRAEQVGLGRYRAQVPRELALIGRTITVRLLERAAGGSERELARIPLVLPAPLEILRTGVDRASLDEIARAAGGRVLARPEELAPALHELATRSGRRGRPGGDRADRASWLLALAGLGLVIAELVVRLLAGTRRDG